MDMCEENESGQSSDGDYNRKDKSLRILCSNFMSQYSVSCEVSPWKAFLVVCCSMTPLDRSTSTRQPPDLELFGGECMI